MEISAKSITRRYNDDETIRFIKVYYEKFEDENHAAIQVQILPEDSDKPLEALEKHEIDALARNKIRNWFI